MPSMREPSRLLATPALLSLLLLCLPALSACGRVPGQFTILNNQVPQPGCTIGTEEGVYRGSGRLDLSLVHDGARSAFLVYPLIENNLPPPTGNIDTNQINMTSFAVDIRPLGPVSGQTAALFEELKNDPLLHYSIPWSGSVASGGGKAAAIVAAFPVQLASRLRATQEFNASPSLTVSLRIRVFGRTTTQDVESDPFDYPVAICAGCLVANVSACPYMSAPEHPGNECNVAQDSLVDCCTSGGDMFCPPQVVSQ